MNQLFACRILPASARGEDMSIALIQVDGSDRQALGELLTRVERTPIAGRPDLWDGGLLFPSPIPVAWLNREEYGRIFIDPPPSGRHFAEVPSAGCPETFFGYARDISSYRDSLVRVFRRRLQFTPRLATAGCVIRTRDLTPSTLGFSEADLENFCSLPAAALK
jgi:hypothetical protein